MHPLDADDIADAIHSAAAVGGNKHPSHRSGDPMVASERTVRRFRARLAALFKELPSDLTVGELHELLTSTNHHDDGDDE